MNTWRNFKMVCDNCIRYMCGLVEKEIKTKCECKCHKKVPKTKSIGQKR